MTTALVLFAHGARDPRWAEPFRRLQDIIRRRRPELIVELAFLEFMEPRLPELVKDLAGRGCAEVRVVPVFFGQGGHVLRDLPLLLAQLKSDHPQMRIEAAPAVGEDAEVLNAIAQYCIGTLS